MTSDDPVAWARNAYARHVQDKGIEGPFAATIAYLGGFLLARGLTMWLRQTGGGTHVQLGKIHLHHMVFGVPMVVVGGLLSLDSSPRRFGPIPHDVVDGALFAAGSAFIVDEFSLMVYLHDEYWEEHGIYVSMAAHAVASAAFIGNLFLARHFAAKGRSA